MFENIKKLLKIGKKDKGEVKNVNFNPFLKAIEEHNKKIYNEVGFRMCNDDYGIFMGENGVMYTVDGSRFITNGKGSFVLYDYLEENIAKA